jgi:hypothetical protein
MWGNAPKILALAIRKCNNSKADTRTSQWQSIMQAYTEELNDNPYLVFRECVEDCLFETTYQRIIHFVVNESPDFVTHF